MDIQEARARVQRGAALLDKKRPGWAEKIDLSTLKLSSTCLCILGQLKQAFRVGSWDAVAPGMGGERCESHGFFTDHHDDAEYERRYGLLQDAWIEAITERLTPPARWTMREPVAATGVERCELAGPVVP